VTLREGFEYGLLALMLLSAALSVLGLLRARDALSAIHISGFASIAVTLPFVLAVFAGKAGSESTVKAVVLLVIVVLTSPISSHALARAIFARSER
jgi:multisubunit Na+/H+ antiporter MnhG subunit